MLWPFKDPPATMARATLAHTCICFSMFLESATLRAGALQILAKNMLQTPTHFNPTHLCMIEHHWAGMPRHCLVAAPAGSC